MDGHPDDSQLIIMHEMEHRSAHDPLLLAAMWGLVTLFPWHPGAWYCLARTRLAIEIDCDARVVGKGASLRNYAQLLVNQARARLGAPMHMWLGATSLLEPSSHLERRLRAMVTPENESSAKRPYMRMMRSASYIAIASTLAIAACESHVPTAADISGLDATSAQKNVSRLFRADPQLTTYYVNDVAVSAEEAAAISADSIASINIIRSGKPGGKQRISLTTVSDLTRPHTYLATPQPAPLTGYDVQRVADAPASGTAGVAPRLMVPLVKAPGAEPLFLINGVASTTAAYKTLDPAKIVSMEVLKQGSAALAGYTDPRAKNGVISITVKP
jgi:hypothetical protein